ncbi:MAG: uL15 family ribosomal protein, partial [Magnetospirillum sp.]|nr:uL15 family ribosomal protein [Magnetospirillum sp.]
IEAGKVDSGKTIDADVLKAAGLIGNPRDGVRLLARGELKTKVTIEVAGASKAAVEAVEKLGGSVKLPVVEVAAEG